VWDIMSSSKIVVFFLHFCSLCIVIVSFFIFSKWPKVFGIFKVIFLGFLGRIWIFGVLNFGKLILVNCFRWKGIKNIWGYVFNWFMRKIGNLFSRTIANWEKYLVKRGVDLKCLSHGYWLCIWFRYLRIPGVGYS